MSLAPDHAISKSDPWPGRIARSPAAAWFIILAGAILRLRWYLLDRGLMHDEALVATNVLTKSWTQLLKPLLDLGGQAAPVGFLLLQKTATTLFGPGEWAVRIIPFAAALAAMPLFYFLVRRRLGPAAALAAVAWMAFSQPLIRYSAEGKQYSTDVLWTLIVLTIAFRVPTRRNLLILAAVGAVAVWFSHPIVFILAGVGAALMIEQSLAKKRDTLISLMIVAAVWLASFAVNYLLITRHYAASDYLLKYWAASFAPMPHSMTGIKWYPRTLLESLAYPVGVGPVNGHFAVITLIATLGFLGGCAMLRHRDPTLFRCIVIALLLCLAASALKKYPFAERLLLFSTPLWIIPLALLLTGNWNLPANTAMPLRAILAVILFIYPVYLQAKYAIHPFIFYDAKPGVIYVRDHWQNGDVVFLHYGSDVLGHYYFDTRHGYAPPTLRIITGDDPTKRDSIPADLLKIQGTHRVWLIFSMSADPDRSAYESILNQRGKLIDRHPYNGGVAELYEMDSK